MDDLRAGLVAAGRAVSEAQQEAEAVKKAVAQQEAAMSSKYGTSIDVLKRLGEVTCVPCASKPRAPRCVVRSTALSAPRPQCQAGRQGLYDGDAED